MTGIGKVLRGAEGIPGAYNPEEEIVVRLFEDEKKFIDSLKNGERTAWATKDSATENIVSSHPIQGRYGTRGVMALADDALKMSDGLTTSVTVGLKDNKLGVHGVGDHFMHGELQVDEFTHLLGPMTVEEAVELAKTLTVADEATFEGEATFEDKVKFKGNEIHGGESKYEEGSARFRSDNLFVDELTIAEYIQTTAAKGIIGQVASEGGLVELSATETGEE